MFSHKSYSDKSNTDKDGLINLAKWENTPIMEALQLLQKDSSYCCSCQVAQQFILFKFTPELKYANIYVQKGNSKCSDDQTRDHFLLPFNSLPRLKAPGKEHLGLRENSTFFWGEKKINDPLNRVTLGTGPSRGGWTRECSSLQN